MACAHFLFFLKLISDLHNARIHEETVRWPESPSVPRMPRSYSIYSHEDLGELQAKNT